MTSERKVSEKMTVYILQTMANIPKGFGANCAVFRTREIAQMELERRWKAKCRELGIAAEPAGKETWCHEDYATIDIKGHYIQWNVHEQELS